MYAEWRPMVNFLAVEHHHPLINTKEYCLLTEAWGCEQLAQSPNAAASDGCLPASDCYQGQTWNLLVASPMPNPLCYYTTQIQP